MPLMRMRTAERMHSFGQKVRANSGARRGPGRLRCKARDNGRSVDTICFRFRGMGSRTNKYWNVGCESKMRCRAERTFLGLRILGRKLARMFRQRRIHGANNNSSAATRVRHPTSGHQSTQDQGDQRQML